MMSGDNLLPPVATVAEPTQPQSSPPGTPLTNSTSPSSHPTITIPPSPPPPLSPATREHDDKNGAVNVAESNLSSSTSSSLIITSPISPTNSHTPTTQSSPLPPQHPVIRSQEIASPTFAAATSIPIPTTPVLPPESISSPTTASSSSSSSSSHYRTNSHDTKSISSSQAPPPLHHRPSMSIDGLMSPNASAQESPVASSTRRVNNRASLNSFELGQSAHDHMRGDSSDYDTVASFQKTLSSDVSGEKAMELLRHVHSFEPIFSELFESADLPICSAILSILTFQPGERIITAGEDASFGAMILSGEVIVQTSPTDFWPLQPGQMIGEMAYYERGPRSADVTAKTAAIIAVLSYDDLDRLGYEGQSELQHKFTMLWSMHTIVKLRNMIKSAQDKAQHWASIANNKPSDSSVTLSSPSTSSNLPSVTSTNPSSSHSHSTAAASPSSSIDTKSTKRTLKGSSSVGKKETLFVERLKKQSEALAAQEAKQKVELANMQQLVKKKINEAQYAHESVRAKITKLESDNKDLLTRVNDLSKKLSFEKKKSKESSEASQKFTTEKIELQDRITQLDKLLKDERTKMKAFDTIRSQLEKDHTDRLTKKQEELNHLQTQLSSLQSEIYQLRQHHQAELTSYAPIVIERDQLRTDYKTLADSKTQLENEKGFADFRVRSLQEQKDQYELDLLTWKRRASDIAENYEKLKRKYKNDLLEVVSEKKKIQHAHKTYHKLIRMLSLKTYVRNFWIRRYLFNIHLKISEMVIQRWEEKLSNTKRQQQTLTANVEMNHISNSLANSTTSSSSIQSAATSLYQQLTQAQNRNKRFHAQFNPTNSMEEQLTAAPNDPLLQPYSLVSLQSDSSSSMYSPSLSTVDPSLNPAVGISVFSYTSEHEVQHIPMTQLRIEKKRYLHALKMKRNPPPSIYQLLQSIDEELIELKTPVDEMNLTILELRSTLTSFFHRNIQLTTKCLNTKKALDVAIGNYNAIKESVRQRHAQEQTANPFTQHMLMEHNLGILGNGTNNHSNSGHNNSNPPPGSSKDGVNSIGPIALKPSRRTPSVMLGPTQLAFTGSADEKEEPKSSSPSSAPVTVSNTLRPRSAVQSSYGIPKHPLSGEIDWAALDDHDKSSGYGVTRSLTRANREGRIHPSGAHTARSASISYHHAKRPSSSFIQPRPPSTSSHTNNSSTVGTTNLSSTTLPSHRSTPSVCLPKVQ